MAATIELVPGRAIGPFQLGMTVAQVEQARLEMMNGDSSLEELGIQIKFGAQGNCHELRIRVFSNSYSILLAGANVNDIEIESIVDLIDSHFPEAQCHSSYGARSWPALGIEAVKWEATDSWVDSIVVRAITLPISDRE